MINIKKSFLNYIIIKEVKPGVALPFESKIHHQCYNLLHLKTHKKHFSNIEFNVLI